MRVLCLSSVCPIAPPSTPPLQAWTTPDLPPQLQAFPHPLEGPGGLRNGGFPWLQNNFLPGLSRGKGQEDAASIPSRVALTRCSYEVAGGGDSCLI
jgi:hypothetical protein